MKSLTTTAAFVFNDADVAEDEVAESEISPSLGERLASTLIFEARSSTQKYTLPPKAAFTQAVIGERLSCITPTPPRSSHEIDLELMRRDGG